MNKGHLVIYKNEDGSIKLDANLEDESIWLTQQMMVDLFHSSKANISEHVANVFKKGELDEKSTVRNFRTVQKEGKRTVSRDITYYNLDMILSVGYRIKSKIATQFRIWATKTLKDYITNGYIINEQRLKEKQEQLEVLKTTIAIIERGMCHQIEDLEQAKQLNSFFAS